MPGEEQFWRHWPNERSFSIHSSHINSSTISVGIAERKRSSVFAPSVDSISNASSARCGVCLIQMRLCNLYAFHKLFN